MLLAERDDQKKIKVLESPGCNSWESKARESSLGLRSNFYQLKAK